MNEPFMCRSGLFDLDGKGDIEVGFSAPIELRGVRLRVHLIGVGEERKRMPLIIRVVLGASLLLVSGEPYIEAKDLELLNTFTWRAGERLRVTFGAMSASGFLLISGSRLR